MPRARPPLTTAHRQALEKLGIGGRGGALSSLRTGHRHLFALHALKPATALTAICTMPKPPAAAAALGHYLICPGWVGGSVLAQGGPAELKFPAQIFIGYIYCNYGAHEHLGGAFANFGSQVGFLCSDCAESDRIDYYALTSDHVRLMAHACVPSSSIAPTSRRFQPQVH